MMLCWEPEGHYRYTKSMVIAPFWFSMTYHWTALKPVCLSANNIWIHLKLKTITLTSWQWCPKYCGTRSMKILWWTKIETIGPFYIGKNQNPKNLGFFVVVPFTLPEKPITFGVLGTKSACAKKTRISYLCFGKWCACATSLYLWPYTCSAHYVAGRGRVIPLKVTYHVTKKPNNTGEIGASVYIGKKPVKFRRSFKKSRCGGGFFDSGFLECLGEVA